MGKVSYTKETRRKAADEQLGLMTFEIIDPGAKPGKMGGRICIQGPISKENCALAHKCLLKLIKGIRA